ncbi:hypothetical protein DC31_00755 [Microbacterium sp. CH12i]|uniref:hypothetical protein n=1 Tax=Microbacterium sp. CH12i TaxID=1479651 RepID=UPI000461CF9E|nr:hypothetical protein [Microbacterium sp. CH12i]KDA07207.1 hypothetical protein DC31_00755 [Microbacterium sp. CH12i]
MQAMLEMLWWRAIAAIGVVLVMLVWRPVRDLLIGWFEPRAGWGLQMGIDGVVGFTTDAHPLGVVAGVAVLTLSVTLASLPTVVFVIAWRKILSVGVKESRPAVFRTALTAGLVMIGTVVIGWIDAGGGSITLDAAWAMSILGFLGGLAMLVSERFCAGVVRMNVVMVLLIIVALSIMLGLFVVPRFF